jgi:hypothetical protein
METADILSAIHADFGLGVFAAQTPREWLQPASMPFFAFRSFATQKLQAMETADILSAIHADFGLGVFAARKPQELETADILSA